MIFVFVLACVLLGVQGQHYAPPVGTRSSTTFHQLPGRQIQQTHSETFQPLAPVISQPIGYPASTSVRRVSSHFDTPFSVHGGPSHTVRRVTTNTRVQPSHTHLSTGVGFAGTGAHVVGLGLPGVGGIPTVGSSSGFSRGVSSVTPYINPGIIPAHGAGIRPVIGAAGYAPTVGHVGMGIHTPGVSSRYGTPSLGVGLSPHLAVGAGTSHTHTSHTDTHIDVNNFHNPSGIPVLHTSHSNRRVTRPVIQTVPVGGLAHGHGAIVRRPMATAVVRPTVGLVRSHTHGGVVGPIRTRTTIERHLDPHTVVRTTRRDTHDRHGILDIHRPSLDIGAGERFVRGRDFGFADVGRDRRDRSGWGRSGRDRSSWESRRFREGRQFADSDRDRRRERRRLRRLRRRFD